MARYDKPKLPAIDINEARLGVLLEAASNRWQLEFTRSIARQSLLKTILEMIDSGQIQNIPALRGMIETAAKDVGES